MLSSEIVTLHKLNVQEHGYTYLSLVHQFLCINKQSPFCQTIFLFSEQNIMNSEQYATILMCCNELSQYN